MSFNSWKIGIKMIGYIVGIYNRNIVIVEKNGGNGMEMEGTWHDQWDLIE